MLTEKAQEQEEIILNYVEKENTFKDLDRQYGELKELVESMKIDKMKIIEEQNELSTKLRHVEKEKNIVCEEKDYLVGILSDATFVLNQALQVGVN